jgi:hypothetical protein
MSSEQRTARETLEQAFRAGFAACQDNTDKYGEYNGDSIEEEFAAFAASLRAAPAPKAGEYRYADCGHLCSFDGKQPGPAPVCPTCAAPAPEGETPDGDYSDTERDCRGCMGPCGRCHEAPASPGPTPEGRETARFRAAVSADYKAGYANGIREAKAETLREVRAKLGQWLDQGHSFTCPVYDGAPCTCGLSAALSALTGGTEGEQP